MREALGGETDLILVTAMDFDDRAALDAGLASDAMRAAGRNLREIAPGLATLLVLEDAPELGRRGFRRPWILSGRQPRSVRDRYRVDRRPADSATIDRAARPRRVPGAGAGRRRPGRRVAGVALVTLDRPEALNALSFDLLDDLAAALESLDADPACRPSSSPAPGTRAFAAGADIRELAAQTPRRCRPATGSRPGTGSRRSACRSSPRSAASRSVAAASWR